MIELLAAPVMQGSRYEQRPIYFSDVVVHRDSPFHSLAQLRGASWAYNEPRSHSGHLLTRYYLETRGEGGPEGYFGAVIAAGSHQRALELILACRAQHVTPVARDAPAASQAAQGRTAAGEIS
jgi:phosphonate transport system substrate-binding protein